MFKNDRDEIARGDIDLNLIANRLDITVGTLRLKLKGEYPFTLNEAKKIQEIIFEINGKLIPLEELFEEAV